MSTASCHADIVLEVIGSARSAAVSPVAASWCRSALHHRLDPERRTKRELVAGGAFVALREANATLLRVAAPVLDQMFHSVGQSGCGVVLSDAEGVILDRRIAPGDGSDFGATGLVEGACWSEAEEGTNGIGTCLYEGRAVVIHRDQHFASRNVEMSCMDAPVHDPHGGLAGALDVSSCRRDHSPAMAEMIGALVREAARSIEREYFCRHFAGARIIFLPDGAATGTALLATDRDGLVIGASRAARLRLDLSDAALDQPLPLDQLLGGEGAPTFDDADRAVLRQALARAGGNVSQAARLLGIARGTFYRRLARTRIPPS